MVCNYSKNTDTARIFKAKQTRSVTPPVMSDVTTPLSLTFSASCAEHCFLTALLSSDGASPSSLEYSLGLRLVDVAQDNHNHGRDLGEHEPIKFTSAIHTPVPQEAISAYSSLEGALDPERRSANRAMEGNLIVDHMMVLWMSETRFMRMRSQRISRWRATPSLTDSMRLVSVQPSLCGDQSPSRI